MELAIERNRTQKNVPIEQNRTFAFRTQSNERVRLKLVIERSGTHKRKMRIVRLTSVIEGSGTHKRKMKIEQNRTLDFQTKST